MIYSIYLSQHFLYIYLCAISLFSLFVPIHAFPLLADLPQCMDAFVVNNELRVERSRSDKNIELANKSGQSDDHMEPQRVNLTSHIQLTTMSLRQTYCMVLSSNKTLNERGEVVSFSDTENQHLSGAATGISMMHTIEYLRLEHHYPILNAYKFAIPEIAQKCKCDCAGGDSICSIEKYQYKNCSAGALCYRTYLSGQQNTGCLMSTAKAELCCQVEINPYRDWTFQAIRLKQPNTVLVLRYRIFEQSNSRKWGMTVDEVVNIALNKGAASFLLNNVNKELSSEHSVVIMAVGGRPHRQVEPGIYFYQIVGDGSVHNDGTSGVDSGAGERLREGVPVNGQNEGSLDKLGWFRWEKGAGWTVRKGLEKVTQAQHMSVLDCKAQRYSSAFNAEHFVLKVENSESELVNYDLGSLVRDEPWVETVQVREREVVVEHAEGVALSLSIRTESRPQIVHHISHFSNFSGTILLDRESNRYLNLTFQNARGTLIGQVYSSPDTTGSSMEVMFSVETGGKSTQPEFRAIVSMPSSVESPKLVCFYPAGDLDGKMCHRLNYLAVPLKEYHLAHGWQKGQSECAGCNERGMDNLLASLDPRSWLDGLNTPTEVFTCLVEVALCLAAILLTVVIFSKCIVPLFRCLRSITRPPKKG